MPIRLPQKTASSGTVLLCPSPGTWHARVLKHPPDLPPLYQRIGKGTGEWSQKKVSKKRYCSAIAQGIFFQFFTLNYSQHFGDFVEKNLTKNSSFLVLFDKTSKTISTCLKEQFHLV